MNLFSRSNQNGAPSEIARAVSSQPTTLSVHPCGVIPKNCLGSAGSLISLVHPIGKPSFLISSKFFLTLHSGVSSVPHDFGVADGEGEFCGRGELTADAAGDGVGVEPGTLLAYS